jgi:hypothetical protein
MKNVTTKHHLEAQELADLSASVLGDLAWLRNGDLNTADEAELRELSGRLRRLLVEGSLQRLRKARGMKGEPRITSPVLPDATGPDVGLTQAGGVTRAGAKVTGARIWNRALSAAEIKAEYELHKEGPATRDQTLSNWLSSTSFKVGNVSVTRRDVICYVANKLGGVHLDAERNSTKDAAYIALDQAREALRILDLDSVYAELAAIGQQLLDSPEVLALT